MLQPGTHLHDLLMRQRRELVRDALIGQSRAARDFVAQPLGQPGRQRIPAQHEQIDVAEKRVMRHHDDREQIRCRLGPLGQLVSAGDDREKFFQDRGVARRGVPAALEPIFQIRNLIVRDLAGQVRWIDLWTSPAPAHRRSSKARRRGSIEAGRRCGSARPRTDRPGRH